MKFPKPRHGALERAAARARREHAATEIRRQVRARDGHKCRVCGHRVMPGVINPAQRAEVHHVRPRSLAPHLKDDPDNLVTVCALCHLKLTTHEIEWTT